MQKQPAQHPKYQDDPNRVSLLLLGLRQRPLVVVKVSYNMGSDLVKIVGEKGVFFVCEDDGVERRHGILKDFNHSTNVRHKYTENFDLGN